ncbi:MAG: GntR family transcriptional regulator [Rhizobiaceae bacterium]|nr:GntR family transcriptional regulator [Rhizobiaceae bacterium]
MVVGFPGSSKVGQARGIRADNHQSMVLGSRRASGILPGEVWGEILVLTPLVSENLAQMAFERLERAILSGAIEPGQKMSEADLARQLGISRGPLREAIGRLEGLGLVTRFANQGPRVTSLRKSELIDLLVFREAVEGMAARHAAMNATDAEIAQIAELLHGHENDPDISAGKGYFQGSGDTDFHLQIAKASHNSRLSSFVSGPLYSILRLYRHRMSAVPGRPHAALVEHRAILTAIQRRDPDEAEQHMRAHISRSRQNVVDHMADDEEPTPARVRKAFP